MKIESCLNYSLKSHAKDPELQEPSCFTSCTLLYPSSRLPVKQIINCPHIKNSVFQWTNGQSTAKIDYLCARPLWRRPTLTERVREKGGDACQWWGCLHPACVGCAVKLLVRTSVVRREWNFIHNDRQAYFHNDFIRQFTQSDVCTDISALKCTSVN